MLWQRELPCDSLFESIVREVAEEFRKRVERSIKEKAYSPQTIWVRWNKHKMTRQTRCTSGEKAVRLALLLLKKVGLATALFEILSHGKELNAPKKVQMKRSVTGGEAEGCCPQRKSPCPTLVGRKTKALSIKAD